MKSHEYMLDCFSGLLLDIFVSLVASLLVNSNVVRENFIDTL
jgi:hypothetical protein